MQARTGAMPRAARCCGRTSGGRTAPAFPVVRHPHTADRTAVPVPTTDNVTVYLFRKEDHLVITLESRAGVVHGVQFVRTVARSTWTP